MCILLFIWYCMGIRSSRASAPAGHQLRQGFSSGKASDPARIQLRQGIRSDQDKKEPRKQRKIDVCGKRGVCKNMNGKNCKLKERNFYLVKLSPHLNIILPRFQIFVKGFPCFGNRWSMRNSYAEIQARAAASAIRCEARSGHNSQTVNRRREDRGNAYILHR